MTWTVEYNYDVFNRRTSRVETPYVSGSPSSTGIVYNWYVYDGNDVILDATKIDGSSASGVTTTRYLWAPHMNAGETSLLLSYEYIYGTPNLAQVNWTLADHQNSIRDVVRATSDTNLQHVGHHVFDSFGNITWVFNTNTGGAFSGDAAKANAFSPCRTKVSVLYSGMSSKNW